MNCIKCGSFVVTKPQAQPPIAAAIDSPPETEAPEVDEEEEPVSDDVPVGFWAELVSAVRQELKPPVSGFFVSTDNAPVRGVLVKGVLELRCRNAFTADMIGKKEILEVVSRKASAQLGRPVKVITVDQSAKPAGNSRMENLLSFGRSHSDIVNMKD